MEITNLPVELKGLLKEVYGDLAKPSVQKVGTALATTTEFLTIPLLLLRLPTEKAKLNIQRNLKRYENRLLNIPLDEISRVPPEIGVEILNKLSYVTDEDISEFYINLLEKASVKKSANSAHPRFIGLISSISPDEARLLRHIMKQELIPYIDVEIKDSSNKLDSIFSSDALALDIADSFKVKIDQTGLKMTFVENMPKYWQNLESLGILKKERQDGLLNSPFVQGLFKEDIEYYKQKEKKYGKYSMTSDMRFVIHAGSLSFTNIGKLFIETCARKLNA